MSFLEKTIKILKAVFMKMLPLVWWSWGNFIYLWLDESWYIGYHYLGSLWLFVKPSWLKIMGRGQATRPRYLITINKVLLFRTDLLLITYYNNYYYCYSWTIHYSPNWSLLSCQSSESSIPCMVLKHQWKNKHSVDRFFIRIHTIMTLDLIFIELWSDSH